MKSSSENDIISKNYYMSQGVIIENNVGDLVSNSEWFFSYLFEWNTSNVPNVVLRIKNQNRMFAKDDPPTFREHHTMKYNMLIFIIPNVLLFHCNNKKIKVGLTLRKPPKLF